MIQDISDCDLFPRSAKRRLASRLGPATFGLAIGLGAASDVAAVPAQAQDVFACTVLLCALSSNPSWSGVPACVGPMTQVLTSIAHGGPGPSAHKRLSSTVEVSPTLVPPARRT